MLIDESADVSQEHNDGDSYREDDDDSYREGWTDEVAYKANDASMQTANPSVETLKGKTPPAQSDINARCNDLAIERSFERERQLSEFSRDRDFIILSIQSALKSRQHKEAQEIVFQYRLASEIDVEFRRLAELTKSVSLERCETDEIQLILDSTPDDDHVRRCALYERLLQIDPSNLSYREQHLLSRRALNLDAQLARVPSANAGHWIFFNFSLSMITAGILEARGGGRLTILYAILSFLVVFFIFPPSWMQFQKKYPKVFSSGALFLIHFIVFIFSILVLQVW